MQNWIWKKKRKKLSKILGQVEKGKQTSFFKDLFKSEIHLLKTNLWEFL